MRGTENYLRHRFTIRECLTVQGEHSQIRLIRNLLIRHFHLIRPGNLKTLKPLLLTPMLNKPFN